MSGMGPIVLIEGIDLAQLLEALNDHGHLYRLRVAIDTGGVKIKLNEGTWTLPYGVVEVRG
jgi:hypothetical protein